MGTGRGSGTVGKRRAWFEVISTLVVTGVAVTMLVFFLIDRSQRRSFAPMSDSVLSYAEDWQSWDESANRIGPENAPVVVAVFSDFECPFCQDLVPVLDSLIAEFPQSIAVDFHHFPLRGHPQSLDGAKAADCARRQGRFESMYHLLFSQMDSIGSKDWLAFAEEADVADLSTFSDCFAGPADGFPRIQAGRTLGERIGVTGTPKIWINGTLFGGERTLQGFRERAKELGLEGVGPAVSGSSAPF